MWKDLREYLDCDLIFYTEDVFARYYRHENWEILYFLSSENSLLGYARKQEKDMLTWMMMIFPVSNISGVNGTHFRFFRYGRCNYFFR